jgi:RNA polymerase sigma-54 factor
MLERMKSRFRLGVTQTQRLGLNAGLQTALRLLRTDAAGLTQFLEEQAAEIPALILRPALPAPGDWLPRWSGVLPHSGTDDGAQLVGHGPSLLAHVMASVPALVNTPADRRIALDLVEALDPTGWLGQPLADIARGAGVSLDQAEAVLIRLQRIDPPGLFARSLAECLRLQAAEAGVLDPVLEAMLDRLDLVASGDWTALSRLTGVAEDQIQQRFRLIRSFNPKPGTAFSALASPQREPDLIVRQGEGGWLVTLNASCLPSMAVDPDAAGAARAREVVRLVEGRNTTLVSIGQAILSHQRAALDGGMAALRPLTMQALAQTLGLHKSTVSRVVAGAAVDTPFGTWWLRGLFSADMGADTSAAALRARLSRLIAGEDPIRPLSDDALAAVLSGDGVTLARRTVAKYRQDLRIPSTHVRRRPQRGF